MTNHPRRERDGDEEPAGIEELAASVPAVQELADELAAHLPPQVPPGFSSNGHTPTARLIEQLPQMLAQAFAHVLTQIPVKAITLQHICSGCFAVRVAWEQAHEAELTAARTMAAQAAGTDPADPQAAGLDFTPYLPPELAPGADGGLPEVRQAITTVQGTDVCPLHHPAMPQGGSKRPFLIVGAPLTAGMLAEVMQGQRAA